MTETCKFPQSDRDATAVPVCDLDRLKDVNDTHGHAVGDAVISAAADRAREYLDDDALIARFGGDEVPSAHLGTAGEGAQSRGVELFEYDCAGLPVGGSERHRW